MKSAWVISVFFHGVVLTASLMALSSSKPLEDDTRMIPVELLTLSDLTNIKAAVKAKKPEDITPEDAPPMTLETPMENAEEEGEAGKRTETTPPPKPDNTTAVENTSVPDKKPAKPIEPEKPAFNLDDMSALIDKTREAQPEAGQQEATQSEENFYNFAENARKGVGAGTDLTMSELDALQTAMYKCWRIPLDAKNPEKLVVRVEVALRSDGHVQSVDLLDKAWIARSSDPYLQVAAQRAVNAVTKCAPYDFLPVEKYDRWKNMTLRFKPEL